MSKVWKPRHSWSFQGQLLPGSPEHPALCLCDLLSCFPSGRSRFPFPARLLVWPLPVPWTYEALSLVRHSTPSSSRGMKDSLNGLLSPFLSLLKHPPPHRGPPTYSLSTFWWELFAFVFICFHSFIQQTFTEHRLHVRPCARPWKYNSKQKRQALFS